MAGLTVAQGIEAGIAVAAAHSAVPDFDGPAVAASLFVWLGKNSVGYRGGPVSEPGGNFGH
jgi:hypothetical protein